METTRQKKVARLIQKELSIILQKEAPAFLGNIMVSVTILHMSPDLANANIFLSIFPASDPSDALKLIKEHGSLIRKRLGDRVRHQLRIIPILEFFLDDSAAFAEEIETLLKK